MGEGLSVQEIVARTGLRSEIIYRRQYRLRQHFGVDSNEELINVIRRMFDERLPKVEENDLLGSRPS
jgi:hypothetical protein